MHIIIGLIGLIGLLVGIYYFFVRAQNTVYIAGEMADMAQTALGAARRFGFRRQANKHPVECIEEPPLAVAGLASAYLGLDEFPTEEARQGLIVGLQSELDVSMKEAEELSVLGNWFVQECQGPDPAISRLSRKLHRLAGPEGLVSAMGVISHIAKQSGTEPSKKQIEALDEIKQIFKV
ncbi:MAG: hypothetical protein GKR98_07725 [Boseongicola sp.]|nr:MAG: hypothetical protein GKR98_07725 [Boseongicola sp.]